MSSDAAIVTPSQLTAFSESLRESMRRLAREKRQLAESVAAAQAVWKDVKYDTFRSRLERCGEELERFRRTGDKYAEFLDEKARLASKYLHSR